MRGLLAKHGLIARGMPAPDSFGDYGMAVIRRLRELAPYAVMELVLPGGSLLAALLWLHRRQKKASQFTRREIPSLPAFSSVPRCHGDRS